MRDSSSDFCSSDLAADSEAHEAEVVKICPQDNPPSGGLTKLRQPGIKKDFFSLIPQFKPLYIFCLDISTLVLLFLVNKNKNSLGCVIVL